ncbi:MAG TPA: arginine repressor [Acidimicrobiia bacterium]|nr:arginine repressor [Acidimicrobiia bacterium]
MRVDTEARRRHVRSVISAGDVTSQEEIREALASQGFDVTQATVSRDLDAIGATRVRMEGRTVYRLVNESASDEDRAALHEAMDEFVSSIAVSGKLLVLKVPPGAAQFVASRIDVAAVDGVLGSIAGDDTILVIAGDDEDAGTIVRRLEGTE